MGSFTNDSSLILRHLQKSLAECIREVPIKDETSRNVFSTLYKCLYYQQHKLSDLTLEKVPNFFHQLIQKAANTILTISDLVQYYKRIYIFICEERFWIVSSLYQTTHIIARHLSRSYYKKSPDSGEGLDAYYLNPRSSSLFQLETKGNIKNTVTLDTLEAISSETEKIEIQRDLKWINNPLRLQIQEKLDEKFSHKFSNDIVFATSVYYSDESYIDGKTSTHALDGSATSATYLTIIISNYVYDAHSQNRECFWFTIWEIIISATAETTEKNERDQVKGYSRVYATPIEGDTLHLYEENLSLSIDFPINNEVLPDKNVNDLIDKIFCEQKQILVKCILQFNGDYQFSNSSLSEYGLDRLQFESEYSLPRPYYEWSLSSSHLADELAFYHSRGNQ